MAHMIHRLIPAKIASAALFAVLALSTAGCAHRPMTTGSVHGMTRPIDQMSSDQLQSEARALGAGYAKNPNDKATALRYASVLQMNGSDEQALDVMRKIAIALPTDRDVLAAYGKALAGNGQLEPALSAIRRAQTPEYPDWKLLSAEGAILDQLGQKQEARDAYQKALDIRPGEPTVLSNLGMSYVLDGDLTTAESYLRKAAAGPGSDSRVRQNLALVVGLQGRFEEAEKIAGQELSPDQAQANVTYLRSILAQQNAWTQLKDDKKKKPAETN